MAIFLCHLIDPNHTKLFLNSVRDIPEENIDHKIYDFSSIQEFSLYYRDSLMGENGKEIDIALLSVPITSKDIVNFHKTRKMSQFVSKIQRAIDYAKILGADTVGLGQFTSIVSKNGVLLNNRGMNLTTGNALTVKFAVDAVLSEVKYLNKNILDCEVSCVGAAGNIVSVISSLIADYCSKIKLVHREAFEKSIKYQNATINIMKDILNSNSKSKCVMGLKSVFKLRSFDVEDPFSYIYDRDVNKYIVLSSNLMDIKDSDIVICGTNSPVPIIGKEFISKNTIILDVSVPFNIKEEVRNIKGVRIIMGGVAKLPEKDNKKQCISTPIFPIHPGTCFACMGETFSIGLSGEKNILNIGLLSKKSVLNAGVIAQKSGIKLFGPKETRSL